MDSRYQSGEMGVLQYTHFTSSHPPGVKKGFIKGSHLLERGYPEKLIQTTLSEVKFEERKSALQQKQNESKRILPFVTTYQPSVTNLKHILMKKWHLIEQQPLLSEIYRNPPLISYKRGRSLKDILVRAKL